MGLKTLAERSKDEEVRRSCGGMFPMDVPKNTRLAINYFTSIGLGVVTDEMRHYPLSHYGGTASDAQSRVFVIIRFF